MKNKKIAKSILLILPLVLSVILFFQTSITTKAYTKEEIEAAKAWLSANGYSPDAGGAAAAYQDYLNGKFGPVPGQEDTGTTDDTNTPATNGGTENPATTQEPDPNSPKQGESEGTTEDNTKDDSQNSKDKDPEKTKEGEGSQMENNGDNPSGINQGQGNIDSNVDSNTQSQSGSTPMTPEQIESVETLIKQVMEDDKQSSTSANEAGVNTTAEDAVSENTVITDTAKEQNSEGTAQELALQKEKKEQAKKQQKKAFIIWAASFAGIVIIIGIIYYLFRRKR